MTTDPLDVGLADTIALQVYDSVSNALKTNDLNVVSKTMAALDRLKREVAELHDATKEKMATLMGKDPEYQYGGFHFERKPGTSRKSWDHSTLSSVVAKRLTSMSIDLDTGEVLKSPEEMIREAFNFAGVSYWRVKELNKIGINADSYCEVVEGKPSIIVRQVSKEQ